MKHEQVKETADQMACKIFEYIHATDLSDVEKDQLFMELATSFFTSTIHENNIVDALKEINEKALKLRDIASVGYLRFLSGNKERVMKDVTDYGRKGERK